MDPIKSMLWEAKEFGWPFGVTEQIVDILCGKMTMPFPELSVKAASFPDTES